MAIVNVSGANPYLSGTSGSDDFVVNAARLSSSSVQFPQGTYYIDVNSTGAPVGGSDTLTMKLDFGLGDYDWNGLSAFIPQPALSSWLGYNNVLTVEALDERGNPFRVVWPNFDSSTDKIYNEIWAKTPESPTKSVLVSRSEISVQNIDSNGNDVNSSTGVFLSKETVVSNTGNDFILRGGDDTDVYVGLYYINDPGALASSFLAPSTGLEMRISSDLESAAQRAISGNYDRVRAEFYVDSNALGGSTKYLYLPGDFDNGIDGDYQLYIDPSASGGIAVETDGNAWMSVNYSDIGISADGKSSVVNMGQFGTSGLTLSQGPFDESGALDPSGFYATAVKRGSATDLFSDGIIGFDLTSGNDTIRYDGSGNLNVRAGRGSDTWYVENAVPSNLWYSMLRIETEEAPGDLKGLTNGFFINISGTDISPSNLKSQGIRLESDLTRNDDGSVTATGQIFDEFGNLEHIYLSSDPGLDASTRIGLSGTQRGDFYYLAPFGLDVVDEFEIRGSAGFDHILVTQDVHNTRDFGLLDDGAAGVTYSRVSDNSRFNNLGQYTITVGTDARTASLTLSEKISAVTGDTNLLSISNAERWSVGDEVTFTKGASEFSELVDGQRYFVVYSEVDGVKLSATLDGAEIDLADFPDSAGSKSTLEKVVSEGTIDSHYIRFEDWAGEFSNFGVRYDGTLAEKDVLTFTIDTHDIVPDYDYTSGQAYWSLKDDFDKVAVDISYHDLYDQEIWITDPGIQFLNGVVDKKDLGFDRIANLGTFDAVGPRKVFLTEYDDRVIQLVGSDALSWTFEVGSGADQIYLEGVSSDANRHYEVDLRGEKWGQRGADGELDIVQIGLSGLRGADKSIQYIDITNADVSDRIEFVDAAGYRVEVERYVDSIDEAHASQNAMHFEVFEIATNDLVMQVRVGGDEAWALNGTAYTVNRDTKTDHGPGWTQRVENWGTVSLDPRTVSGIPPVVNMTSGNDQALLYEDRGTEPYLFGAGNDYVISMSGDHDVAMGAGDDFILVNNSGQQSFISGGAGEDNLILSGKWLSVDGEYFATDWTFGSIDVAKAQEYLKLKYPDLPTTRDSFEWGNSALDRVMVAENVFDGTKLFFQTEFIGFGNGSVGSGKFMPAIEESYDTTVGNMSLTTLYGRETNDTVSLKVDDVDTALKYIGTWLDSVTTSLVNTGDVLRGAHTLQIKAQPLNQRWFSEDYTNAGFNLVDIENIRLWDGGDEVTIRVAGSSGYESVDEAIRNADRGDVIFVAETRQGDLQANNTRTVIAMDTSVTVDAGLRVAFEENGNRVVNRTDTLTVTLSGDVVESESYRFLGTNSSALEVLGTANVRVFGSQHNDIIIGNSGDNFIGGRAGNDLIFGGNGDDILHGASGDDTLIGGSSHRVAASGHFSFEDLPTVDFDKDEILLNNRQGGAFQTGDRLYYEAAGGSGFYVRNGTSEVEIKSGSSIYAVVNGVSGNGTEGYEFQFAASYIDALAGKVYDLVKLGTATSQSITLFDNYTAANLPGNDYVYGGTGDDHLIAAGVMGAITSATAVHDTLTMNGGSGDDEFTIFGNTGRVNMFGGSGQDQFQISDTFLDAAGVNKSARIVDFSATQDRLIAQATDNQLSADGFDIESYLSMGEVSLSQLVAPPLPIVSGSGENGNYEAQGDVTTDTFTLSDFGGLTVEDLIAMHYSHAA